MEKGALRKGDIFSWGAALSLSSGIFTYLYNNPSKSLTFAGLAFTAMGSAIALGKEMKLDIEDGRESHMIVAFLCAYSAVSVIFSSFPQGTLVLRAPILLTSVLSFSAAMVILMEEMLSVFTVGKTMNANLPASRVREFLFTPPEIPYSEWLNGEAKNLSLLFALLQGFGLVFFLVVELYSQVILVAAVLIAFYTYFFIRIREKGHLTTFEWFVYIPITAFVWWAFATA